MYYYRETEREKMTKKLKIGSSLKEQRTAKEHRNCLRAKVTIQNYNHKGKLGGGKRKPSASRFTLAQETMKKCDTGHRKRAPSRTGKPGNSKKRRKQVAENKSLDSLGNIDWGIPEDDTYEMNSFFANLAREENKIKKVKKKTAKAPRKLVNIMPAPAKMISLAEESIKNVNYAKDHLESNLKKSTIINKSNELHLKTLQSSADLFTKETMVFPDADEMYDTLEMIDLLDEQYSKVATESIKKTKEVAKKAAELTKQVEWTPDWSKIRKMQR
jgi:hypothetical protein